MKKANSNSSVFDKKQNGSLADPDTNQLLLSMSIVFLTVHIAKENMLDDASQFSIFDDPGHSCDVDQELIDRQEVPTSLEYIFEFLSAISESAQFSAECHILALVYVNRMIAYNMMPLHVANFRSVAIAALLIAQKVWDDRSLANADFSAICPMCTVARLNALEARFLQLLDYDLGVSARLYAKYYFEAPSCRRR